MPDITPASVTCYFEAYATGELDGPRFALCDMTQPFIQRIVDLSAAVRLLKVSCIEEFDAPEWQESDLRPRVDRLVVDNDSFYWTAHDKHTDIVIETRMASIEKVRKEVQDAIASGNKGPLFFGDDLDALKEAVADSLEIAAAGAN